MPTCLSSQGSGSVRLFIQSSPPSGLARALSPHPSQYLDERFVVEIPHLLLLRKLAYGEVRLLLAGAALAKRYAPDLHRR